MSSADHALERSAPRQPRGIVSEFGRFVMQNRLLLLVPLILAALLLVILLVLSPDHVRVSEPVAYKVIFDTKNH